LNKKLATHILLCFLGVALLSNRFFLLQQSRFQLDHNASLHLPLDNDEQPQEGRKTLLVALPNEGVTDLHEPALDAAQIVTDSGNALQGSRFLLALQILRSSPPPAYILQSALNL